MFNHPIISQSLISLRISSLHYTLKSYFLLQLIQLLQTFSIIIPPFSSQSPAWDYSTFSPIFIGIGVLSRPLTLSYFTDATITIMCLFFALTSICILGMIYSSYKKMLIHRYTDPYYRPSKLDIYLGYLRCFMIEVGFIPGVYMFIEGMDEILSDTVRSCMIIWFIMFISLVYVDSLYLKPNSWNTTYNAITCLNYILVQKVMCGGLIVSLNLMKFTVYPMEYSIILILYGILACSYYYFKMPYANLACNLWEGSKGAVIGLAGILNFLNTELDSGEQDVFYLTLLYFLVLPITVYIYRETMITKYKNLMLLSDIEPSRISDIHLFHTLFRDKDTPNISNFTQLIILSSIQFHRSPRVFLWILQYYLHKYSWADAQIIISSFYTLFPSSRYLSYIQEYEESIHILTKSTNESLHECYKYLSFQKTKSHLLQMEREGCIYSENFLIELLSPNPDHSRLSSLIIKFSSIIHRTEHLYISLLKTHRRNFQLLSKYSEFLQVISNPYKANDIKMLAHHCKESSKSLLRQEAMSLSSFHTMIFYMHISKGDLIIYKSHNAKYLGYSPKIMKQRYFYELVPKGSRDYYKKVFRDIGEIGTGSDIFYKKFESYLLDAENYMTPVIIVYNLIANQSRLQIMASFTLNAKGSAIAFLSEDGSRVESMVRFI